MAYQTTRSSGPAGTHGPAALVITVLITLLIGASGGALLGWTTMPSPTTPSPPAASASEPQQPSPTPVSSTTDYTPSPSATPSSPEPTPEDPQHEALSRLRRQASKDRDDFPFDGRWAAQVASKYVGSTDRFQRPESGDTFRATDIWAEYSDLKRRLDPPYTVKLLYRGNKIAPDTGRKYWYTFVTDDFGSRAAAQEFCDQAFSTLSRAARSNQCLPRQLPRL